MSSVLHPAGPEPAQTYWMRRVGVIAVAVVVLAITGALIANGTSSGSAVQASPSPPPPGRGHRITDPQAERRGPRRAPAHPDHRRPRARPPPRRGRRPPRRPLQAQQDPHAGAGRLRPGHLAAHAHR